MITVNANTTAAQLQSLIDHAAAGETISLAAGNFTFDRTVVINRDDISVVGQGSDLTHITVKTGATGFSAFQIGSTIDNPTFTGSYTLAHDAADNATTLTLANTTGLKAGDSLWIDTPNTAAYLASIGDTQWLESKPLQTSMVQIASIKGNVVTLANAVDFAFSSSTAVVQRIDTADHVTLSGFSIDYGLGAADASSFTNEYAKFDRVAAVSVSASTGASLSDIDITNPGSIGFNFAQSIFLNAKNISVEGSHDKGDDGNGYAVQLRAVYDSSITGITAIDTRHAVVFASWTTESNNTVEVDYTNRDINFHGGPDHNNTVVVEQSIRTTAESTYLAPTLFVNTDGTSYGAPTVAGANTIEFGTVWGTNKAETLTAVDIGSVFHAGASADTLIGGAGNDQLYADTGSDLIVGSGGSDYIDGGQGADTLSYSGSFASYAFGKDAAGHVLVYKAGGVDTVTAVENFKFADMTVSASDLSKGAHAIFGTAGNDTITITHTADVVFAGLGYDRIEASATFTLGADAEALDLLTGAADGTGNNLSNSIIGNDAANTLLGLGGDDRMFGRGGNDIMHGGDGTDTVSGQAGNDVLYGDAGNDTLDGGAGNDTLFGGSGDDQLYGGSGTDVFHFSQGTDTVFDFTLKDKDKIALDQSGITFADVKTALAHADAGGLDTLATSHIDAVQTIGAHGTEVDLRIMVDGQVETLNLIGINAHDLSSTNYWAF